MMTVVSTARLRLAALFSLGGFTVFYDVKFFDIKGAVNCTCTSLNHALEVAKQYAEPLGFTNIKVIQDEDSDECRIVGKTPGGRSGRNIAHVDAY